MYIIRIVQVTIGTKLVAFSPETSKAAHFKVIHGVTIQGICHKDIALLGLCYSQTRSSVPVANELMNSVTEK